MSLEVFELEPWDRCARQRRVVQRRLPNGTTTVREPDGDVHTKTETKIDR